MGASAKWLKSLISLKKASSASSDHGEVRDKGKKKWRLWRSVSEGLGSAERGMKNVDVSDSSESAISKGDAFSAAMATVARAPAKEFMAVKQEWAAIRIQTAFRRFLAKQALRALKSVVRIQAIFRGRMVRKQADMTLKCMQALVRVQSRVRAQCMKALKSNQIETGSLVHTEVPMKDEIRTKLQMREEAAVKRGRPLAVNRSQKTSKSSGSPNSRTRCPKNDRVSKKCSGWSCGEGWMREKYIGSPFSRKSEGYPPGFCSYSSEFDSLKVRRNNVTTRISAKPHRISRNSRSSSTQSSESFYDDYSASSSPTSESTNLVFSRALDEEMAEESITSKPSYMNLTASTMAKQRGCQKQSSPSTQRRSREESQLGYKMMTPTRGSFSPINSGKLCRNLYPPTPFRRRD